MESRSARRGPSKATLGEVGLMSEVVELAERPGFGPAPDPRVKTAPAPILAAVDLGEMSHAAVLWASELAEKTGASLLIMHVIHDPAERPGKYVHHKSDPLEPMADTAERMLLEFLAEMRAAHPGLRGLAKATTKLARGLPAQTIVNEARALGASLIVIGSRGRSSFAQLLFGSNAQGVTKLSPIPVTVVKAPAA